MMAKGFGNMQLVPLMQGEAHVMKSTNTTYHFKVIPGRRLLAPRVSVARFAWLCLKMRCLWMQNFGKIEGSCSCGPGRLMVCICPIADSTTKNSNHTN